MIAAANHSQREDLQRLKDDNNARLDAIENRLTTFISSNTREVSELKSLLEGAMPREQGHGLTKVDLENALKPISAQLQNVSEANRSSEAATEFSERQKANITKWIDELPRLGKERMGVENLLSALLEGQDDLKDRLINLERRSSQVKRLSVRSVTPLPHTLAEASTRPQYRKSWGATSIDRLRHSTSTDTLDRGVYLPGH